MVPTTETVKPILKQRKPPAAPGPAPFKNASFSKLINILRGGKNRPTAVRVCPQPPDLLQPRPPPPFHSCAPGWGARSGGAPGDVRRGARALVAGRPPRERESGARSGPFVRRARAGLGARAREARGARGAERSRRAVQRGSSPGGSLPLRARTGHLPLPWPPVAARRRRVSTRLGERPPHNGCKRSERRGARRLPGTDGGRLSAVPSI